jgi:hypothetical protein
VPVPVGGVRRMSDPMPHSVPAADNCPVCQRARGKVTVISAPVLAGDEVAETVEALATAARWVRAAHQWHEEQDAA